MPVIGDYTVAAFVAPVVVVTAELVVLRTGLLRTIRFWATVAITLAFQIPVDGWLTRMDAPIVAYRAGAICGIRWPFDIPIEDFGFGFALITATLLAWATVRRGRRSVSGR